MFDSWFYKRCMTLVDNNGRRLQGEAMEQAETILNEAKLAGFKVWADKNGLMFKKAPGLFSKAEQMFDRQGNPLHICGHQVHIKANYCSKCSGDAPGGWWRCGECGKPVGNESSVCPHCGHHMNPVIRSDMSTGSWVQRDGVFAERFDLADVNVLLPYGINIQENQRGLLLEGGELTMVMKPGHYACENFRSEEVKQHGEHAIVFVDLSEFSLPLRVKEVYTKESMTCDVHVMLTLQFDQDNGNSFLCNLMRNRLEFRVGDACPATLGYDEIMQKLLEPTDDIVRHFCREKSIDDLFKSGSVRTDLEREITEKLAGQLHSLGLRLVRLGELDFDGEAFNMLSDMEKQMEETRRKNEFMLAADKIANDATMRKVLSDQEMEDYMANLAQRAQINAGERELVMKRIRRKWAYDDKKDEMSQEYDLNLVKMTQEYNLNLEKLAKEHNLTKKQMAAKSEEEIDALVYEYDKKDEEQRRQAKLRLEQINNEIIELDTRRVADLRRVLEDTQNKYDKILIEEQIKNVEGRMEENDAARKRRIKEADAKLENNLYLERERAKILIYKEWAVAKQEITKGWITIKGLKNQVEGDNLDRNAYREIRIKDADAERENKTKDADVERTIKLENAQTDNMVKAGQGLNGVNLFAIIAAAKDASARDKLVEAHLGEIEARMKPEVILAAMAKRGNDEAQARIDRMDEEHRRHLEKTVEDNKQMYQTVMNMNERMFNQMTEKMTRPNGGNVATTNVIKQE